MFNNNINSIEDNNNSGFKQLMLETRFDSAQKNVQALKSQSGDYIIATNNTPLDSYINPLEETKRIYNEKIDKSLKSTDIVVVFGLGLGYLLKRVFVETQAKIVLYEPNKYVLRFALEYVDFSDIFKSNRLIISNDMEYTLSKINALYFTNTKINLVFNDSYLRLYTKLLSDFSEKMIECINAKKSDLITICNQSKMWVNNILNNLQNYKDTRPINYLKNKFANLPALIICAGPSLKDDLEFIKNNQDKFVIIVVNKIVDFVLKNDILPDFVIASDATNIDISINSDNLLYNNINFIFSAKCSPNSFMWKNNSIWLYYPKNSSLITDFINNTDASLLFSNTSSTTSIYAYECAKILGCKDIVFSGLDLAYKGNEHYSDNVEKHSEDIANKIRFTQVKSANGQMVQTRNDYAMFVKQFEQAILNDKDVKIYNLTSFGAYIEGMEYISTDELIDKLELSTSKEIEKIIKNTYNATALNWNATYDKITTTIENYINKLKLIDVSKIESYYTIETKINFPINYYEVSPKFIEFIKEILQSSILGEYFQAEILDFLAKFESLSLNSIEELNNLRAKELEFITQIEQYIANFK